MTVLCILYYNIRVAMPSTRPLRRKPPVRKRITRKKHDAELSDIGMEQIHIEESEQSQGEPVPAEWLLPRMLTAEEKRELIHAHHHARKTRQKEQSWGVGYYVAVAASCLMVITGWVFTMEKNIRQNMMEPPKTAPLSEQLKGQTEVMRENLREGKQKIDAAIQEKERLDQMNRAMLEQVKKSTSTPAFD